MNGALYKTWRFTHPDFERYGEKPGLRLDSTGRIDMVAENDSVRQALLLLLTTVPGDRVMRPDYGCDLYRLTFSPNDETTHGLAIHYIRSAITRWEPRVEVRRLDAYCNEYDAARMDIMLDYRVRRTAFKDTLFIPFDLQSENR